MGYEQTYEASSSWGKRHRRVVFILAMNAIFLT